jgi:predicted dehydrogenase
VTRLRLAIVGVGDVAQRDYLPEVHRLAEMAEIAIVCSRQEQRARSVAEQYAVPRWTTEYRAAIESDVDAVVNLTPLDVHHEINRAALERARHVYTEKPLAASAGEARELRDLAARQRLVLVCAPSVLLFPQIGYVRELLASGRLGVIRSARAQANGGVPPWEGYASDPSPFFGAAGGPLVDMAVYPLHALTGLLGPVSRVAAMARRTRDSFVIDDGPFRGKVVPVDSEDHWQLLADLPDCVASVEATFATAESVAPECELRSEGGAVAFSLLDVAAPVRVLEAGAGAWTEVAVTHERASGPDHILGVIHMIECITSGRPPLASADHAVHVLDVIEAARRSAASAEPVPVDPSTAAALPAVATTAEAR